MLLFNRDMLTLRALQTQGHPAPDLSRELPIRSSSTKREGQRAKAVWTRDTKDKKTTTRENQSGQQRTKVGQALLFELHLVLFTVPSNTCAKECNKRVMLALFLHSLTLLSFVIVHWIVWTSPWAHQAVAIAIASGFLHQKSFASHFCDENHVGRRSNCSDWRRNSQCWNHKVFPYEAKSLFMGLFLMIGFRDYLSKEERPTKANLWQRPASWMCSKDPRPWYLCKRRAIRMVAVSWSK